MQILFSEISRFQKFRSFCQYLITWHEKARVVVSVCIEIWNRAEETSLSPDNWKESCQEQQKPWKNPGRFCRATFRRWGKNVHLSLPSFCSSPLCHGLPWWISPQNRLAGSTSKDPRPQGVPPGECLEFRGHFVGAPLGSEPPFQSVLTSTHSLYVSKSHFYCIGWAEKYTHMW